MESKRKKKDRQISLAEHCIAFFEKYIYEHNLKPGDSLPSATQLCSMMGVSLSPLREAMKILESRGEIKIINGKGSVVGAGKDSFQKDISKVFFGTETEFVNVKKRLLELLEVRKVLERQMIENVVRSASDEELLEVEKIMKHLMEKQKLVDKLHRAELTTPDDKAFHNALAKICHNNALKNILNIVSRMFQELWENDGQRMDLLYADTI
jgi:GntR family transcriptional regulator, transcriptional repressor for pyruvate dehydrogenase complex